MFLRPAVLEKSRVGIFNCPEVVVLSLVKYVLLTYFSPWHTNPANVARAVFWQIDRHAAGDYMKSW